MQAWAERAPHASLYHKQMFPFHSIYVCHWTSLECVEAGNIECFFVGFPTSDLRLCIHVERRCANLCNFRGCGGIKVVQSPQELLLKCVHLCILGKVTNASQAAGWLRETHELINASGQL